MSDSNREITDQLKRLVDEQWEKMQKEFSDLQVENATEFIETHTEDTYNLSKLELLKSYFEELEKREVQGMIFAAHHLLEPGERRAGANAYSLKSAPKGIVGRVFLAERLKEEIFNLNEYSEFLSEEYRREKGILEWEKERRDECILLNARLKALVEEGGDDSAVEEEEPEKREKLSQFQIARITEYLEKKTAQVCENLGEDGYLVHQYLKELVSQYLDEKDPYVYVTKEHNEEHIDLLIRAGIAYKNMNEEKLMRLEELDK